MVDSIFVYIGPTIRGVIQKGTVYVGNRADVEATLDMAIGKYPRIKNLLVGGDTLAADRISVKTPGTRLCNECRKLVSEVR